MPGNKSEIIPANNGKSMAKNLGTLTSCKALNNNCNSSASGSALFKLPAVVMTVFTARIP